MLKLFLFLILLTASCSCLKKYEPTWDSLDSRPLPKWYDDAKIGIFIHWGVFSVPSFESEWFWYFWQGYQRPIFVNYMKDNYKPGFTYQDFAKDFTAEFFNATWWAQFFKHAGAKYVVLTAKHHEGYTLWPSKYSYSWNAKDIGPGRDLVGELASAVRSANLTFGLYHSLFEWFNPLYLADKAANFSTRNFPEMKSMVELRELVEKYKPEIVWSDGEGGALDTYWDATGFLAWLYNESPVRNTVVANDRWGIHTKCKHGGVYTCTDRYNPGTLQTHKWENAMSLDRFSWGYRRTAILKDYMTTIAILTQIASTVSCGGNILMNIGAAKDGTIPIIFQDRLKEVGDWLYINGNQAIYGSKPWTVQNDTLTHDVWYTSNHGAVNAIVLFWPPENTLKLASVLPLFEKSGTKVYLVGNEGDGELKTSVSSNYVSINFPVDTTKVKSKYAYVLKIEPAT